MCPRDIAELVGVDIKTIAARLLWQARLSREKNKRYLEAYQSQCGYTNYNKAAVALETMVTNLIGVAEAAIEPVKADWNAGYEAEPIGMGAFEIGSLLVGGSLSKKSLGLGDETTPLKPVKSKQVKLG